MKKWFTRGGQFIIWRFENKFISEKSNSARCCKNVPCVDNLCEIELIKPNNCCNSRWICDLTFLNFFPCFCEYVFDTLNFPMYADHKSWMKRSYGSNLRKIVIAKWRIKQKISDCMDAKSF